ncbi:LacI family DNA-binding transcriptional regulator [Mycolicibacterium sp. 120270]|uniref:LacI family DNA-binding transcriptional regulator n=1 Tax=Mycolicibacterium sp. 120270 TaxID=3090600 RepID=UPI00299DCED5|nr:LacI family DNA-binding transcriptional regulator [Mycolicibacterium sp. 120270]MDX1886123.1 LacI family DNA-binding transcriptional regulator [Mycolicibacterium sp. 120270]
MASIRDVAAAAGVSPTTVSHALNNRGRIAEETRVRVLKAAAQLGYQANVHAQQLVTRRSRIIAIQLPTLEGSQGPALPDSAYFLDLINGAAAAADSAGYALVVTPSGGKASIFGGFAIDGAIIVDPQGDEPIFATGVPVVTVGHALCETHDVLAVDNDHATAARLVLDHFEKTGRRRPAMVADDTRRSYVDDVISGYREWVRDKGLRDITITLGSLDPRAIDRVIARFREEHVDAAYTSSDDLALAVLDAASRAGVAVPKELAIASAVDAKSLTLTSPQISATNLFPFRTGGTAAQLLMDRLENNGTGEDTRLIPTQFVARASSAAADAAPNLV